MGDAELLPSRWKPAAAGLALSAAGALLLVALFAAAERQTKPGWNHGEWLIFACPALITAGFVVCVRGLWMRAPVFSRRNLLFTGLAMLVIGGCPWLYTGSGEGGGMLGTLLFLSVGLPGLIIIVAAGFVALIRSATGN